MLNKKLVEIVAENLCADPKQITAKTNFVDDLNADSLDAVEILMECEEEFNVIVPDEEFENVRTVGDADKLIKRLKQGEAA